ncbi:hypothetical protein OAU81_00780 [bacterium]|nr:hypothetical protein [bacterium]
MNTFKQYYTLEENRRSFLKSLFGGAAALSMANPAQAAAAVAKSAGTPWIKATLESDFTLYDYTTVDPQTIAKLSAMKGDYTPGVSKDGSITIDYNDSAMDMMEVYVKPGTPIYKQMQARIDGEEQPGAGDAYEFDKQVFDTISDPDGSGASWLEQQLENDMDDSFMKYEKQPDDWKEEIATVDGFEPDHYEAAAQKDAADRVKQFLDQAGEIGAEVPEHMRDIVGRGYMKSHVLANGSGSEAISNDTMVDLRDLYDDEDIDYPDEMDSDRWLDGSADNPMDSMAYDSDRYQQDMDQVTGDEDQDDIEDWITAGFNFLMGASQKQEQVPVKHLSNVPGFYDAIKKGRMINGSKFNMSGEPDMSEPLQISHDGREPIEIIGGFEQLAAADEDKIAVPRVQMIHVDELQAEPESTSKYLEHEGREE